jgi:hypothetical protein
MQISLWKLKPLFRVQQSSARYQRQPEIRLRSVNKLYNAIKSKDAPLMSRCTNILKLNTVSFQPNSSTNKTVQNDSSIISKSIHNPPIHKCPVDINKYLRKHRIITYGDQIKFSVKDSIKNSPRKAEEIDMKEIYQNITKLKSEVFKVSKSHTLKTRMLRIIYKLKLLNLMPNDLKANKIFCTEPYEKCFSHEFIAAAKCGNEEMILKCLRHDKYLVYSFDHTKKTALHWATQRKQYRVMVTLCEYCSDPDSKDFSNKTPLHLAVFNEDLLASIVLNS